MKARAIAVLTAALAITGLATPATAHHSFAMFDQNKQVKLDGVTVTRFEWTNPHSFVVALNGTTTYTLECSSPNLMSHQGWKFDTIKAGDKISILYYPLRNGQPGGMLKTVTLPSGKTISAW